MKERLIELLQEYTDNNNGGGSNRGRADFLLANGVEVVDNKREIVDVLKSLPMLEANVEIAKMRVETIKKALECLTDEEKTIIDKIIMNGECPDDVSFEMNIERSTLYNKRKKALDKIYIALYGMSIENLSKKTLAGRTKL